MRNPQHVRPVDLAREHGLSTQAIRNYEDAGILPAASRSSNGYRAYTPVHGQALRSFLALVPGHGRQASESIMRNVNTGHVDDALRIIDEGHAQLLDDRTVLRAVETALVDLASVETDRSATRGVFIGPLAHKLGVEPATLRKWERVGLIRPHRDQQTGYRIYTDADVRDAQLIRQLRRGGYLLEHIAPVIAEIRTAGGIESVRGVLTDWHSRLTARGRAMLDGAAELNTYIRGYGSDACSMPSPAPRSSRARR